MNCITQTHARRFWLKAIASGIALGTLHRSGVCAQEAETSELYATDAIDRAIDKGIEYLLSASRDSGAIVDRGHDVAMTSLAIMALASVGVEPGLDDERSRVMFRAIDFVLDKRHQDGKGYFGNSDGSRMYGHGIITLMLTEMLGMGASAEQNMRIHDSLEKAIELILAAQAVRKPSTLAGGWRYTPTATDSDLSVSVWQLMALRSAKNDGLEVPVESIELALRYLKHSYTAPKSRNGQSSNIGGFSYTPGHHHPAFTMTSAGLLAMQVCGQYESTMVSGAAEWLLQNPPRTKERFFHYGVYYYAQGMHQAGGKYAEKADAIVPKLLLDIQEPKGSWIAQSGEERNVGRVYATALSILSLSVRYHYLPIYQR
ncbi:MAG: terpene cyclase/mutase family protein [Pirellulaceae bacterium]|nr:terpene cyclase/mutase family protein [Pirellulaceae bacterium]